MTCEDYSCELPKWLRSGKAINQKATIGQAIVPQKEKKIKYLQPSHDSAEISGEAIKHSVMNDWPHSKPINDVMIELSFTE